jgi:hypothetical protein
MYIELSRSFRGNLRGFRSFTWKSSNNISNKSEYAVWKTDSSVKKGSFLKYLKLESLFGSLDETMLRALYDAPGVLEDEMYMALRAIGRNLNEQEEKRMDFIARLQNLETFKPFQLKSLRGRVFFKTVEYRITTRKHKPFSGYVRNNSRLGRGATKTLFKEDTTDSEYVVKFDFTDIQNFITVGELPSWFELGPVGYAALNEFLKRTKR